MKPARVLIVDDNALNIELVRFVLEAAGFEVASAPDADTALAQIGAFEPAVVLMDIQLPGMSGLTLTRQIKADPALRHLVVVAHTAYAMKGDAARLLAAGCDGYLAKPIDVRTFGADVRSLLQTGASSG